MVRVIWGAQALGRLNEIHAYVAVRDELAAGRLVARLVEAGNRLDYFPNRGRPGRGTTRELPSVPPYVILYEVTGDEVRILDIKHGRQRR